MLVLCKEGEHIKEAAARNTVALADLENTKNYYILKELHKIQGEAVWNIFL
jgi:hypothetical protein